jgi:ABC-2 type transport system ATP-binding protein
METTNHNINRERPSVRLQGLRKEFETDDETVTAVDGVSLTIEPGEIVALLGPNGAGKTTTIDMILGFTAPTGGTVEIFGGSPRDAVKAGRVSAVLQTGGLLRDLKVGEAIELVASTYAAPAPTAQVMERAGIADIGDRMIQACSGGQVQRLRFALALLADPDLLLLDEPTAGMDVEGRQHFWAAMQAEAAEGRTIVFATHYLQEAEDFARRTVVMDRGRVVADGPTEEIRRHASGRTVDATVDDQAAGAVVRALNARGDVHRVAANGGRLAIQTSDSDAVARTLLVELGGRDLEIHAASLETAFVRLTGTGTDTADDNQPELTTQTT